MADQRFLHVYPQGISSPFPIQTQPLGQDITRLSRVDFSIVQMFRPHKKLRVVTESCCSRTIPVLARSWIYFTLYQAHEGVEGTAGFCWPWSLCQGPRSWVSVRASAPAPKLQQPKRVGPIATRVNTTNKIQNIHQNRTFSTTVWDR